MKKPEYWFMARKECFWQFGYCGLHVQGYLETKEGKAELTEADRREIITVAEIPNKYFKTIKGAKSAISQHLEKQESKK